MRRKKHGFGLHQLTPQQFNIARDEYLYANSIGSIVKFKNPYNNTAYDFMFSRLYRVIATERHGDVYNSLLFITPLDDPLNDRAPGVIFRDLEFARLN